MKKGQVSTELMIIIGLVLLIFIPLLVLVYFKASESNAQIASYQAELAVFRLAYMANSVGSLGTNSSISTDVFVPKNTEYFRTRSVGQGGEIVLAVNGPQGKSEIVEIVRYPITEEDIADASYFGSWVRLKVSSEPNPTGGVARLHIERERPE
ncbi:hypothetical protein HY990_05950 [Candidatus Micrarchaeota archaeon]|nr:hypothetical protein [Candidatus Micrarchaeota archaeon]